MFLGAGRYDESSHTVASEWLCRRVLRMSRKEHARANEAYEFDLIMTGRLTDGEVAAVIDAGADDQLLGLDDDGRTKLCFTRAAPSLGEALVSAIRDVQRAGLEVADVRCFGLTGPDVEAIPQA